MCIRDSPCILPARSSAAFLLPRAMRTPFVLRGSSSFTLTRPGRSSGTLKRVFVARSLIAAYIFVFGSAAIPSMRTFETGGFIALVIPFFTDTWMDEESGTHEEVTDFKKYRVTRENNKTPKYYCVRLSHNGKHIRQLCDPTDDTDPDSPTYRMGRNTGVVRQAVEEWWNDLKRGHYLDEYTRSMVLQLQLRSNHLGVRFRITLMFELTSLGSIMPSYDFETRTEDIFRYNNMFFLCNIALGITGFFCALEGIELIKSGPQEYFSDMWNVMDWMNFSIFFLVWWYIQAVRGEEQEFEEGCPLIC